MVGIDESVVEFIAIVIHRFVEHEDIRDPEMGSSYAVAPETIGTFSIGAMEVLYA